MRFNFRNTFILIVLVLVGMNVFNSKPFVLSYDVDNLNPGNEICLFVDEASIWDTGIFIDDMIDTVRATAIFEIDGEQSQHVTVNRPLDLIRDHLKINLEIA